MAGQLGLLAGISGDSGAVTVQIGRDRASALIAAIRAEAAAAAQANSGPLTRAA